MGELVRGKTQNRESCLREMSTVGLQQESWDAEQGTRFSTLQPLAACHFVCSCHCTAKPLIAEKN